MVQIGRTRAQKTLGLHKPGRGGVQRLVEVSTQCVVGADLTGEQQLAAIAVELGLVVSRTHVVAGFFAATPGEVDARAHQVGAPWLFGGHNVQCSGSGLRLRLAHQLVRHIAIPALAVGLEQIIFQRLHVQRCAGFGVQFLGKHPGLLGRQAGRTDGLHRGVGQRLAAGATQPNRIVFFADCQAAQRRLDRVGGSVAPGDGLFAALEVARCNAVQSRPDIDINPGAQKGQRLGHILLGQQIDHLPGNGQWGCIDVFGFEQGRAHVDRNHDVGLAQLLYLGEGHVVDQAAVHQAESFVLHRRHQAGH